MNPALVTPHPAPTVTVFTSAYNRAHTLHRVYDSLRRQTFRAFEWLIVDDGSTDGTQQCVQEWQREADFPIRYLRQENQGKHVAFNHGVREARGAIFVSLDSDDACVPEALQRFKDHWEAIPQAQRHQFSGVTCLCVDQYGRPTGDRFPQDVIDSDGMEIRYRHKVSGEQWECHRTEILRQFPFPEVVKRQYIPEGLIWARLARVYRTRFVNEALRIYYIEGPSMVHGGRAGRNAFGARMYYLMVLNEERAFLRLAPVYFLRSAALYVRSCFHLEHPLLRQAADVQGLLGKALWVVALPVGFGLYWWETRYSNRA
jgi:glycosyltransferase involved in cell wall biosynthesis